MKKQVKISVCKSNVRKDSTYYARVCKKGKLSERDLVKMVKEKAPYIDIHSLEIGLEVLGQVIVESIETGLDVELFGLGTVGLKGKGSIKVSEPLMKNLDGTFDKRDKMAGKAEIGDNSERISERELSVIAKKNVEFTVQFSPSRVVKKHIKEHVEPSFITMKMQKPRIESIEKIYSGGENAPSVIKIKGEDLKLVGEGMGLYLKMGGNVIHIPKEAIIQNEPKTLMFLTNIALKEKEQCSVHLSTQYAKMGHRKTSIVRRCVKEFSFGLIDKTA
ncbi:MAG: DUF4469 domain-containing protein [Treponema sp.]